MLKFTLFVVISIYYLSPCRGCFFNMIHDPMPMSQDDLPEDFGTPLYLSPLVESGDIERARRLSKVGHLPNFGHHVKSYSGFLTVNKDLGNHLFFWFFPALNKDHGAPVVIWLQGGPGLSSMIGVFAEHGPFSYDFKREMLTLRNDSWANTFNMLYIDNPVGTGFSHAEKDEGYATNQTQIAEELFSAINQFFVIFYDYKGNNLYIAGEGYACKYITGLAYKLHTEDGGPHELDLKGIAIGNPICDPATITNRTEFLYQAGLIDEKNVAVFANHSAWFDNLLSRKHWTEAIQILKQMYMDGTSKTSFFRHITGMESMYDIRYTKIPAELFLYTKYLSDAQVRKALHVGMIPFSSHRLVCRNLIGDLLSSMKNKLEHLMNDYKVLIYDGHLDILVPYAQMTNFVKTLNWKRAEEKPRRIIWTYAGGNGKRLLGGYVHHVGDFLEAMVWRAGHFAPLGAPQATLNMISRFIWGKSFH